MPAQRPGAGGCAASSSKLVQAHARPCAAPKRAPAPPPSSRQQGAAPSADSTRVAHQLSCAAVQYTAATRQAITASLTRQTKGARSNKNSGVARQTAEPAAGLLLNNPQIAPMQHADDPTPRLDALVRQHTGGRRDEKAVNTALEEQPAPPRRLASKVAGSCCSLIDNTPGMRLPPGHAPHQGVTTGNKPRGQAGRSML